MTRTNQTKDDIGERFVENFLEHHGVKGMKWGIRKAEYKSLDKASRKKYRKKTSKERRTDRDTAYKENLKVVVAAAASKPQGVFVSTRRPGDGSNMLLTGKEFTAHLAKGGYVDIKATNIYGYTDTKEGRAAKKYVDSQMDAVLDPLSREYVKK